MDLRAAAGVVPTSGERKRSPIHDLVLAFPEKNLNPAHCKTIRGQIGGFWIVCHWFTSIAQI